MLSSNATVLRPLFLLTTLCYVFRLSTVNKTIFGTGRIERETKMSNVILLPKIWIEFSICQPYIESFPSKATFTVKLIY